MMKKALKIMVSALVLGCICSIAATTAVSAKTYSGKVDDGCNWTVDTDTQSLTLEGTNDDRYMNEKLPITRYKKQIKHLVYEGEMDGYAFYHQIFDDLKNQIETVTIKGENGACLLRNLKTKTDIISGSGKIDIFKLNRRAWPWALENCEKIIISDGITDIQNGISYGAKKVKIGKDLKSGDVYADESYEVDPQNLYFSSYQGCLYSKDHSKLVKYPMEPFSVTFHPDLRIFGESCFQKGLDDHDRTIVIPWGITVLERGAISDFGTAEAPYPTIILPDSLIRADIEPGCYEGYTVVYSKNNQAIQQGSGTQTFYNDDHGDGFLIRKRVDSVASYYGNAVTKSYWQKEGSDWYYYFANGMKASGYQVIDGKVYYFGKNGAREHDKWKQINSKWYYLNSWGAGVVKCWRKSGNKWYFLQADGSMATSKWIEWYHRWYYVGEDGAMYTNRRTPDGYWVNSSGVWVK